MDYQVARVIFSGPPAEGEYSWIPPAASQLLIDMITAQAAQEYPEAAAYHIDELRKNIPRATEVKI